MTEILQVLFVLSFYFTVKYVPKYLRKRRHKVKPELIGEYMGFEDHYAIYPIDVLRWEENFVVNETLCKEEI